MLAKMREREILGVPLWISHEVHLHVGQEIKRIKFGTNMDNLQRAY